MKQSIHFIKSTILGGAIVIVPVVLILFVLIEAVDMLAIVTDPITELLPVETVGGIEIANVLAILIILGACFLAGLGARSRRAAELGRGFENAVLGKLPMYKLIKTATRSFSPKNLNGDQIKTAVLKLPDQTSALVVVIEQFDNGHAVVFMPRAPMPTMGDVRYVACDLLEETNTPLGDMANVFMQWGYGAGALFDPGLKSG